MTRHLVLVYRRKRMQSGSTVMRTFQMARLIGPHMSDTDVEVRKISRRDFLQNIFATRIPAGSVVMFDKGSTAVLSQSAADRLRRRGCRLCFDPVDTPLHGLNKVLPDLYISPSLSGVERIKHALSERGDAAARVPVMPVLHAADERLYARRIQPKTAACCYWGARKNAVLTPEIEAELDVLDASVRSGADATLDRMLGYDLHYGVRPPEERNVIKPFTKGAIAAVVGANIVVNRDADDAVDLLGDDYPYMCDRADVAEALAMLRHARDTRGGTDWSRARDRMDHLAEAVSPPAIARQMSDVLSAVT